MAVSIFSLIEHNRQEPLHFHILSDGLSPENREKLRQLAEGNGKEISFYELGDLRASLSERVYGLDTGRFQITTLARLLMGSLLPDTVTKALYLDADTVVLRPLHSLYKLHLGNRLAAMAPEPTIYPEVKALLGLPEKAAYYNAGVILLNLSGWREQDMEENCFSYYNRMGGRLPFNDQDILNYVLRGQIVRLPQRFNFFSNYYYFRYDALCRLAPWYAKAETEESFFVAKHHPVLVHFAGAERPWIAGNHNHYRRAYQIYLRQTPFADSRPQRGSGLSMQLYHAMNVATFVLPGLRKRISQAYFDREVKKQMGEQHEAQRSDTEL